VALFFVYHWLTLFQVVGSVLSNLLLVLGMCFFAGGMRYSEQGFSLAAAQINSSLLIISVVAVLIPGVLYFSINTLTQTSVASEGKTILKISHGVSHTIHHACFRR
jgi:Ca2+:H+ antiporter